MKMKKGFSLLELVLVLGVGTMVAFMKFQDMKASQEDFTAKQPENRSEKLVKLLMDILIYARYDLIGKAMQTAGVDSGMTQSTTVISGMQGQWQESSSNFSNITGSGLLGFRTGFNSALYSIYLRRDGTLPMTGDLNMGNNDINNAKNITASGTGNFGSNVNSGGNVTAAAQVIAHNGYGDTITLGGDAAGYSSSAGNYTTVLQVNRNAKIDQRLGLMGYDPNELPSGWDGGLRTLDVYAAGTVGIGSGGTVNAYMNSSGNIYASNDINAGHQVNAQYVWASGNLNSNYIHSNGNIDADRRINAGEFVYINGKATIGAGCSPNGLIGRTSEGRAVSCVNGVWKSSSARIERTQFSVSSGSNYGDICQSKINSNGMAAQGWVASGSDACTEDGNDCSVDNVRCFAIRIVN